MSAVPAAAVRAAADALEMCSSVSSAHRSVVEDWATQVIAAAAPHLAAERRCVQCGEAAGETDSTVWHEGCLDIERTAVADLECEEHDKRLVELESQLEHAKAALAGDHEGVRLWMLDCAQVSQRRGERIAALEKALREALTYERHLPAEGIADEWRKVLAGDQ